MTTTEDYPHALHTCRRLMHRSNTTASESPLLFRACMCANHWSAACAGIVTQEEAAVASGLSSGHAHTLGHTSLRQGPVIPLCTVLGIVCVGVVVTLYAYKNRGKLEQQAELRDRRRTVRLHVLSCEVAPVAGSVSSSGSTSSESPSGDLPPPYAAAEPPPPYQMVCSDGGGMPKFTPPPILATISEGGSSDEEESETAKPGAAVRGRPPDE